ncbi:DUF5723 family protein [Brumimicrobium mesophilum]|uniref:DUF5723 family protein n=1 Tax=Brumimicrobium mesophilum TaxID=392717 RepID=UPI000D13F4A6|nr:DUF5723 family protein [Brumimicrobium mesophilum]
MNTLKTSQSSFILTILLLFLGGNMYAQSNYSYYTLDKTAQSHYLNPAFKPSARVYVSFPLLPSQNFTASNSGFTLNDILVERPQDDSLQISPENAIDKMKDKNFLTFESNNEIFAFGIRLKKSYFSFGVTSRMNANFIYNKDFFKLAIEGNGKTLLGERANFDGTEINLNSYIEYAVGFNREINEKLAVGARVKLLSGVVNVNTRKTALGLHTNATTFDLTIDGSATLNTSGIKPLYDTLSSDNSLPIDNAYNFKNFGLAFDLGAVYKFSDKFKVSASVIDLGFIDWKTDNATFNIDDFNYRFEGIDVNKYINDTTDALFTEIEDSLTDIFSQEESDSEYRTGLTTRFYLSGAYNLSKSFSVGVTLYNEILKSNYRATAIVSGTVKLRHWLSATVNYAQYSKSFGDVGAGLSLRGGPVQFFVSSNNILGFINPQKYTNFHANLGINFLFGNPDKVDKKKRKEKEQKI